MEANRISDESQRKTILLNSCGITTYKLFKGLKVPAISQNAVIQSGFLNNKAERQILKVRDEEVKKCCRCDGNHAVGVTEIMQPSHALSSIKRIVFIVTTKIIQAKLVVKRQNQIK